MRVLKLVKGIGRFLLDILFLIAALILSAMVFNAVGVFWAVVISIPSWIALAWIYRFIFGPRTASV